MTPPELLTARERHDLTPARVAVIGAGIAGATVARCLKQAGVGQVTLLDKGRSLGGRASSRLIEGHLFEFGASLISDEPAAWLETVAQPSLGSHVSLGHREPLSAMQPATAKVCGVSLEGGVKQLVTLQARFADRVERSARVSRIERECSEWWVYGEQYVEERGEAVKRTQSWGPFDALVVAIPSPQAAQLLFSHQASWARQALKVRYEPSVTLSVCFEAALERVPTALRSGDAIMLMREALPSIERARAEVDEGVTRAWVIQMSSAWSAERIEWTPERLQRSILEELRALLGEPIPQLVASRVHRWRYASPCLRPDEASGVLSDHRLALYVCGDWTSGPNGAWAFMSGQEAAGRVIEGLRKVAI